MQIDRLNVCVAPEKLARPYGMQLMYRMDNNTLRNIYVCAESGEVSCCGILYIYVHIRQDRRQGDV